ncbi:MAG: biopolymer transporter ExbD [Candidatus Alcyoniella australis]|nr:biopolymer transporter ExbD [Candidatus Alcyoniella australis]
MAFAATKRKRIGIKHVERQIQMTSLMDMFTILLCFLLGTYDSVQLQITPSENLTMPTSINDKLPSQEPVSVMIAKNAILVGDSWIVDVSPDTGDVNSRSTLPQDGSWDPLIIPELYQVLKTRTDRLRERAQMEGTSFTGKLMLMGDKDIPYGLLKRVMITAGKAEFGDFQLLTYQTYSRKKE